jgi:zinc transport system substrate-binding protein
MNKIFILLFLLVFLSCRSRNSGSDEIITVSIPPFAYFVEEIAGDDFMINVMVPPGADPHIYEPVPGQITSLSRSVAYISNGNLGFELAWLERFYGTNKTMQKLSLAKNIDMLEAEDHGHSHGDGEEHAGHSEGADPHFWISPKCAAVIAEDIREFLCSLRPEMSEKYNSNFGKLSAKINSADSLAAFLFAGYQGKPFMIFHPSLGYLARDYNIRQISVETEGKEPSPADLKRLIDTAKSEGIKTIFIQEGFDTKNASAIASETGAEIVKIDPLARDWYGSVTSIVRKIHQGFINQPSR